MRCRRPRGTSTTCSRRYGSPTRRRPSRPAVRRTPASPTPTRSRARPISTSTRTSPSRRLVPRLLRTSDPPVTDPTSGLVVVDKAGGMTSHDVVARVRRLAGTRKVGHAGTLDPMATGVLVLGVERATRLLGHLALTEKAYDARVRLGVATTTDDAEGEVLTRTAGGTVDAVDEAAVRAALGELVGDIEQVPSSVSAVKIDGERAYRRVRAGEDVQLPARPVT